MTRYRKPPLSIQEQLDLLQQRGLAIGDTANANRYLQRVGYYRLMGYLYTQRMPGSDNFRDQATFEEAVSLYEFDRALRDLVMEAVGHIEVATRTVLTYHFAHSYGAFGHLEPRNLAFIGQEYADWLGGVESEVTRSKEAFIRHYKDKYASPAFPEYRSGWRQKSCRSARFLVSTKRCTPENRRLLRGRCCWPRQSSQTGCMSPAWRETSLHTTVGYGTRSSVFRRFAHGRQDGLSARRHTHRIVASFCCSCFADFWKRRPLISGIGVNASIPTSRLA